jgi:uncharacterized DUF497 family protein
MEFPWDSHKNRSNRRKHSIDLREAALSSKICCRQSFQTQNTQLSEKRFIGFGVSDWTHFW